MPDSDLTRRLREMPWPTPSDALRVRALSAPSSVTPRVTWSDRLWFSRAWRIAGALTFLALIAIEPLADRFRAANAPAVVEAPVDTQAARAMDAAGAQLGLPADITTSLVRRAQVMAARTDANDAHVLALQLQVFDVERQRP